MVNITENAVMVDAARQLQKHGYGFVWLAPNEKNPALTAVDLYYLVGGLESRRRWKRTPSGHDAKKSGARLEIERAEAGGAVAIRDLEDFTLEDLLLQLASSDHRAIREALYEGVRAKLDALGFVEE